MAELLRCSDVTSRTDHTSHLVTEPVGGPPFPRPSRVDVFLRHNARVLLKGFLTSSLVVVALLALPSGCFYVSDFGCMDGYGWRAVNQSNEDMWITPYWLRPDGTPRSLVVHGVQRGRFYIGAGSSREIDLETGDFSLDGILVEYRGSGARMVPVEMADSPTPYELLLSGAEHYPIAAPSIGRLDDYVVLYGRTLLIWLAVVLTLAAPVGIGSAVLRWRLLRSVELEELRVTAASPGSS